MIPQIWKPKIFRPLLGDDTCWLELTLFEPRWHGWARWRLERHSKLTDHVQAVKTLDKGWTRRPRGSQVQIIVAP